MITIRKPDDKLFNYAEVKELYERCNEYIKDDEFNDVINNTEFYAFYIAKTRELMGCIYYFWKGRRLFVNAFAERGHHLLNLECFKLTLSWWKVNVYANAIQKTSRLCVLKCGFEKVKDNLYVYRRRKNGK